ncbi:MAG: tetratricopeptide repeat protein [Verrucomicrobiales bacterium]
MDEIAALRKQGLFAKAQRRLEAWAPAETWTNPEWQVQAARVFERVGEANRAQRLVLRLWRRDPSPRSPVREEMLWVVQSLRGPLIAWDWWRRFPIPEDAAVRDRSDDWAWAAYLLGRLRDFSAANERAARALETDPANGWPHVVLGWLASWQDRHDEALDRFEKASALNPSGIGGLHALAEALVAVGRDADAVAVLEDASWRLEAASLPAALTTLRLELGDLDGADGSLGRFAELVRNGEPDVIGWLAARRCDIACHRGRYDEAAGHAAQVPDSPFYARLAVHPAAESAVPTRRELPVGFVRQHHLTCAPATLTTLARYWRQPLDHLQVAEAICYDGTPYHSERRWAEENGWATREFTVTQEAARTLIDAGLPFALSTVSPGNGHCQAVIGYDDYRAVLLIRDPYHRSKGEFLIEEGLKHQAPFGPRGLVMVPVAEAARLEGLVLPDQALYDAYHRVQLALERHQREEASHYQALLESLGPGHRLSWHGRHALACYDGQPAAALAALDALHELFPKEVNTQLRRLNRLGDLARSEERLIQLSAACAAPDSDSLLWLELARSLASDARRHPEAHRWLRRCLRHRLDAWVVHTQGSLWWDAQMFEEATRRFRWATCLDDKNEHLALSYFRSARAIGRTEEALAMLRARCEREGNRSSGPARSLAQAYEILDRIDESFDVLAEAQARRPDDAELLIHRAEHLANWGREAEAESLLATSEGRALRPTARLRVLAALASRRGESAECLEHWRRVLESEPLAMDAHRAVAGILSEREGSAAGLAHLRRAADAHPHYQPLQVAVVDWARAESNEAWEEAVGHLLHSYPTNAWAHREQALVRRALRRWPEALASIDEAIALDPAQAAGPHIRGLILLDAGRREEGRHALRAALRLGIEADGAMAPLLQAAATPAQRLEDLRFLQAELIRQTTTGDAVMTFAELAAPYLEGEELISFLRQGAAARPDLWQTGAVLARQLARGKYWDEAIEVATSLTTRFPLIPRVWVELGLIRRARPDHDAAIKALAQACQINPAWPLAMQELAASYRAVSRFADARATMETAVRHAPGDALNHGWLAEFLYHDGELTAALNHLREALRLSPGYDWAWGALDRWGREAGQPDAAADQARSLVAARPGEARSWYFLAQVLGDRSEFAERMTALDRALELNPRFVAARDEKARHLALAGRFDQALALCQPEADGTPPPPELAARGAWILAQKGELPEAIAAMHVALGLDPALSWGWELLADWHQSREEWDLAEAAVSNLIRLNPHRPFPHGYLGDLKRQRGDRDGAKREFLRALDIDAGYTYGGLTLFDLHLEDRQFDRARTVLDRVRPHLQPQTANARDVIFHIAANEAEPARSALRTVLACPDEAPPQIAYVMRTLRERRPDWASLFRQEALDALERPDPHPHAGRIYAESEILRGKLPGPRALNRLPPGAEVTERALDPILNELSRRLDRAKSRRQLFGGVAPRFYFARLRRRYGAWLHSNDLTWGLCGYVLFSMNRYRRVCQWLADWPERPAVQPWMLNNLAVALQIRGQGAEFQRVADHVLSLPQHDDTVQRFLLWAALDQALNGRRDDAHARLAATDPARYDAYDRSIRSLVDSALCFSQPDGPVPAFDAPLRDRLRQFAITHRGNRLMNRAHARTCHLIAQRRRSLWPRLWGWTQRHRFFTALIIFAPFYAVVKYLGAR